MANHATRTVDGQILEGIGVTPDITLPFRETELTNGNDTWMDRAISYIQNGE
jgi:C-terminal processing protease CtpA/Prc